MQNALKKNHVVEYSELALTPEEADEGAYYIHNAITYLMALQIKDSLKVLFIEPRKHKDSRVRDAFEIARLIRTGFKTAST